jgi:periplasmic protein TonB
MIGDSRLLVCAGVSFAAHVAVANGLQHLPKRAEAVRRIISLRVVSPPPAVEPPPEPTAPTPESAPKSPVARVRPLAHRVPVARRERVEQDVPPPDRPESPIDAVASPTFGVTMESTSAAGGGPAMPVGQTSGGVGAGNADDDGRGASRGVVAVVPAYEATAMPMPQGRCEGKYTPEALHSAIEGTVILDVVVGETGRVREIRIVSGLGGGLTEAAITAIKACRFSPGEKEGRPVPVRIPGYKIRFLLPTDG